MLGASGLLAGLGGGGRGRDSNRSVDGFERRDRRKFDSQFRRQLRRKERRIRREDRPNRRIEGPDACLRRRSSGFPMWAIILIVIVVLLAIWWFMTQNQKPAEPAKTGLLSAPIEYALSAVPAPAFVACSTKTARVMGLGGAVLALATRAAERSSGAISSRRHLCDRPVGDRRRLLQPPLRHPRRRTERAGREPGRPPCGDDPRARA